MFHAGSATAGEIGYKHATSVIMIDEMGRAGRQESMTKEPNAAILVSGDVATLAVAPFRTACALPELPPDA